MKMESIAITAHVQTITDASAGYRTISSQPVRWVGDPASLIRLASTLLPGCTPDQCSVLVTPIGNDPTFRVSFSDEPRSVGFDVPIAQLALCIAYILAGASANGFVTGFLASDGGGRRKRRNQFTPIHLAALTPVSLSLH